MTTKLIRVPVPETVQSKVFGEVSLESSTYVKVLRQQSEEIKRKESGQGE
jgi:hypothetical protein